ncbi:MAG: HAD-IIIC family phosphatase [Gemmatimonadales bacterium]
MRFAEALKILQSAPTDGAPFKVLLGCGFTPIHVQTFLGAHIQRRVRDRRVRVIAGAYGDAIGTFDRQDVDQFAACALVLEWADLDARLGFRRLGGWGPGKLADILRGAEAQVARLTELLERVPTHIPLAVSLPTLRPAPVFFQTGWEAGSAEFELRRCVVPLSSWAVGRPNVHIVSPYAIDQRSAVSARLDFKNELVAGISYTQSHSATVGEALANLLQPVSPKKGLITDLDGTLWRGIVGDVGVDGVFWDLDNQSQLHGLYQQLLVSLAEEGVLIAVASRNNPAVVGEAFARSDMVLRKDLVFPMEVHWNKKSDSVRRILDAWNVGAEAVVFVDDSPMELAEVQTAYPEMECLPFPEGPGDALALFYRLRDLFGRDRIGAEDALRRESLRSAAPLRASSNATEQGGEANTDSLLREAEGAVAFDFRTAGTTPRSLELVNKTNQFNLNGRRYSDADWHGVTSDAGRFVVSVSYKDKFGPLGTIAVIGGELAGTSLLVDLWVMSCRAFARRVEHRSVATLFERFGVDTITFDYAPTTRNEPLQKFFTAVLGTSPTAPMSVSRDGFFAHCPPLYHSVTVDE